MKVMIIIPIPAYSALLAQCQIASPEYGILKNGIVEPGEDNQNVRILCTDNQAKVIREFVSRVAPQFAGLVREIPAPMEI